MIEERGQGHFGQKQEGGLLHQGLLTWALPLALELSGRSRGHGDSLSPATGSGVGQRKSSHRGSHFPVCEGGGRMPEAFSGSPSASKSCQAFLTGSKERCVSERTGTQSQGSNCQERRGYGRGNRWLPAKRHQERKAKGICCSETGHPGNQAA